MQTETRPSPDPSPDGGGAAPALPTTPACDKCGTRGGYAPPLRPLPFRARGLCMGCYKQEHRLGHLDRWTLRRTGRADTPHTCRECGKTFLAYASRRRSFCSRACYLGNRAVSHPEPPPRIVTPAMIGIRPGQPPTDPDCTPDRVWEIANTNARRALRWLTTHTTMPEHERIGLVVWEPARPTPDAATPRAAA